VFVGGIPRARGGVIVSLGVLDPVVFLYPCPFVHFPVLLVLFYDIYEVIEAIYPQEGARGFPFAVTTEGFEVHIVDGWGGGSVLHW
jgi:hypothetical protein